MTYEKPLCYDCIYYWGLKKKLFTCKAFPNGIPDVILESKFMHTKPYKGDHGIQFEAEGKRNE